MSDMTELKAELYEKNAEIERLKARLAGKEAELAELVEQGQQKSLQAIIVRSQQLDTEVKSLSAQKHKRDERIADLEKQSRNQKKTLLVTQRQLTLADRYIDLVNRYLVEVVSGELTEELRQKIGRIIMPDPKIGLIDISMMLHEHEQDDEKFKELLKKYGLDQYETIITDLSLPID